MRKLIVFLILTLSLALPALAEQSATETVKGKVNQIINILKDPNYTDSTKYPAMRKEIEDVVLSVFDFKEMSSRTVGPSWKTMSPAEQEQITEAFMNLLRASYLDQVTAFNGIDVVYSGERKDSTGKVEVQTQILAEGKSYPVNYRLMNRNGQWLVYDVIIADIALIKNYREQFQDVLAKGSTALLIDKLNTKVAELRTTEQKNAPK